MKLRRRCEANAVVAKIKHKSALPVSKSTECYSVRFGFHRNISVLKGDLPVKVTGGVPTVMILYQSEASSSLSWMPLSRLVERLSWDAEG